MLGLLVVVTLNLAGGAGDSISQGPLSFGVWAMEATREGASPAKIDPSLESVREALAGLPHDTFRALFTGTVSAAPDQEKRTALTPEYTLVIRPGQPDKDGRLRLRVCLELKTADGAVKKALDTSLVLAPGKKARMGGPHVGKGDLVVVVEWRGQA